MKLSNVNSGDYIINITNVLGEIVYDQAENVDISNTTSIDLSDLSKGVYLLNVSNSDLSVSRKIIVE